MFGMIHTSPPLFSTSLGYKNAYALTKILIKKNVFALDYSSSFSGKLGFLHLGYVKYLPMEQPSCIQ